MIPTGAAAFHGIYPSTVLPMRTDFAPHWEAYARHIADCVLQPGIVGVLCNGHAGENFTITADEKQRAIEVTVATVGASRIVIAGINQESSLAAAAEAQAARPQAPTRSWCSCRTPSRSPRTTRWPSAITESSAKPCRTCRSSCSRQACMPAAWPTRRPCWSGYRACRASSASRKAAGRSISTTPCGVLVKARASHVAVMASGDEHLLACYVHGSDGSVVSLADIVPGDIVALDAAVRRNDLKWRRARAYSSVSKPSRRQSTACRRAAGRRRASSGAWSSSSAASRMRPSACPSAR